MMRRSRAASTALGNALLPAIAGRGTIETECRPARDAPSLQQRLLQLMSRNIVNDHRTMLHLGSMRADERIAAFLLDWGERMEARGHSGSLLVLPMGRLDVGSYLGSTPDDRTIGNVCEANCTEIASTHL